MTYATTRRAIRTFETMKQTNGRIKVQDIMPLGCSPGPDVCDTGTFLVAAEDGGYTPPRVSPREGVPEYFDPDEPRRSVPPDILTRRAST